MVVVSMNDENIRVCIKVRKEEPVLVFPAEETYKGPYFLSILDQCPLDTTTAAVQTLYCFKSDYKKSNEKAFHVIKAALSRILVYYYPLAGRVKVGEDEKLFVDCNGEGALMVEASADCNMEELGDLTTPDVKKTSNLIYAVPGAKYITDIPPLIAQVTKFKCGGFVIGLTLNHCLFDGFGATEFVTSWGEMARGLPLRVPPFLDKKLLQNRVPPHPIYPHQEFQDIQDAENAVIITEEYRTRSFCFDRVKLEKLKAMVMMDGTIGKCTTFEVLSAFMWQERTKALCIPFDQQVKLMFPVDGRSRLDPPLPKCYFGNAVVFTGTVSKAGQIVASSLSFVVGLIQKALKMANNNYIRSVLAYKELEFGRRPIASRSIMVSNTWARLPFLKTNFGWGEPLHWGPVTWPEKEVVLFLSHGEHRSEIKALVSLPEAAMRNFEQSMEYF